jgi:hypothetical protein
MISAEEFTLAKTRIGNLISSENDDELVEELESWLQERGIDSNDYDLFLEETARLYAALSLYVEPIAATYATLGAGFIMGWTCREISEALSAQAPS